MRGMNFLGREDVVMLGVIVFQVEETVYLVARKKEWVKVTYSFHSYKLSLL